ncbi:hypothetical protein PR048_010067 [Dryococelus australis]|uniref:Uncharacterized protein n=1 Tax=Dryococelus australis TaxID=614101 RepID=A0ABQ9I3K9_9NEOP|nr:hypothetical protein PR048_010067 [Dryococelus australis]
MLSSGKSTLKPKRQNPREPSPYEPIHYPVNIRHAPAVLDMFLINSDLLINLESSTQENFPCLPPETFQDIDTEVKLIKDAIRSHMKKATTTKPETMDKVTDDDQLNNLITLRNNRRREFQQSQNADLRKEDNKPSATIRQKIQDYTYKRWNPQ